jgi:hypothetical protein
MTDNALAILFDEIVELVVFFRPIGDLQRGIGEAMTTFSCPLSF